MVNFGVASFRRAAPGTNLLSGTFAVTGSPSTTGAQLRSAIGSSGAGLLGLATVRRRATVAAA